MSIPGDERIITKDFFKPTKVGEAMVFGPTIVRQRLMVAGVKKVFGKEIQETSWVDIEVIQ